MSNKKQPEQLETATTHSGKDHTKLVEKVRDAKHDPRPKAAALAARKTATGQGK
jgi:hypothetical protein